MSLFKKFAKTAPEAQDHDPARVPPGQKLTKGFPVLTYGPTPVIDAEKWSCRLFGLLGTEVSISWQDLLSMPQTTQVCDIHCVTTWSKLDMKWTGVRVRDFLAAVEARTGGIKPAVTHVMQHSTGGYTTNTTLEDLLEDNVLLAHAYDGKPLEADHGGPVRVVLPKLYFWKSAKWLNGLEFMSEDRLGFWERYGYHNHGDPWLEERFSGQ
jgi:DMSO/TMAO reductase YedYZ molybdopterin-dependent catalytic subunit